MDATVLKIGLAGLMHDMGKFVQNGLDISKKYRVDNADLYQPFRDNHHTHQHALYTAAFIELLADLLPKELNSADWGDGDSFINLAAGHHRPETPMQWVISLADRISSGQDRATFEKGESIGFQEYRRTRLLPLFEQINLDGDTVPESLDEFGWRYPLECVSADSIFPQPVDSDMDLQAAKEEYLRLYEQFLSRLRQLKNRENSLDLWAQHFDSLLHSFTSHIPAARVGNVVPDVSLYDHAKTTAALAVAQYLYHYEMGTLNVKDVCNNEDEPRFLLISGDFFGIQDFIFSAGGETTEFRSKLLRGRSFCVSIFSELAADMVCRALGLPFLSVMLNAAGKFTVLAPNTEATREGIDRVRKEINDWLFSVSYGQSTIGLTSTPATRRDFHSGEFGKLWARHKLDMEQVKACRLDLGRYGGAVEEYLDSFDNRFDRPLCPFCGVRPSQIGAETESYLGESGAACNVCRDHIMMGTMLVKGRWVVVIRGKYEGPRRERLAAPLFGQYQVIFNTDEELEKVPVTNVIRVWNTSVAEDGLAVSPVTNRFFSGYVPVYRENDLQDDRLLSHDRRSEDIENVHRGVKDGRPKTFADIARLAMNIPRDNSGKVYGTEALGILKADVDNLGLLMGCGLPEERYTVSRMATLSRQLDSFFSIYLPHLLATDERFGGVYTVFAGGDDLFLIGPWNRMVELALFLRERFAAFVCKNEQLHFSAGIIMSKTHVPVNTLASRAEHALEKAKESGRNRVTVFDETIDWEQLATLVKCGEQLDSWRGRYLSGSVVYRLNELVRMAAEEKNLNRERIHISEMQCLRWRSQLNYQLVRNLSSELKGEAREAALNEMKVLARWLQEYGGAMKIPLWNILYNQR